MSTLRKPPRLLPGDTVAIAAPAGAVKSEDIAPGIAMLRAAGFVVRIDDSLFERHRYFAGTDTRRAAELVQYLLDPTVKAIICARGGYGTQRVVTQLQPELFTAQPKIVVGYSDITVLQAWLYRHCQWVGFYGPSVRQHLLPSAPAENLASLLAVCSRTDAIGTLPANHLRVIRPGTAEGVLAGGCLTLVHSGIGTSYEWPLDGSICFLEDRGEKIYALDRMLTHLKDAGAFRNVAGVIFGSLVLSREETAPQELDTMLAEIFADFHGPVLAGFPAGHCDPFITLPLGCHARLTSEPAALTILEGAVV